MSPKQCAVGTEIDVWWIILKSICSWIVLSQKENLFGRKIFRRMIREKLFEDSRLSFMTTKFFFHYLWRPISLIILPRFPLLFACVLCLSLQLLSLQAFYSSLYTHRPNKHRVAHGGFWVSSVSNFQFFPSPSIEDRMRKKTKHINIKNIVEWLPVFFLIGCFSDVLTLLYTLKKVGKIICLSLFTTLLPQWLCCTRTNMKKMGWEALHEQ